MRNGYWPLSFVAGGGVLGLIDELGDDGGVLGLIEELDEEDGGVLGVVDDGDEVDGAGVTTGGLVRVDVFVSRWQPASPSARPAQSSVAKAVPLIVVSKGVEGKCIRRVSRFGAIVLRVARRRAR